MSELIPLLVAVIMGGIFGWTLGKLPDRVVYGVMAIGAVLVLVLLVRD